MSRPSAELLDAIERRKSAMAYDDRIVPAPILRQVFEAARWAPSSFNEQPWRFVVGTRDDPESHQRVASCLSQGNAWAREAPVLIVGLASTSLSRNGRPNAYHAHDLGLALENLLIQATALGLASHPMGGFDKDRAAKVLRVPENYRPVTMVAIGYPGDPAMLSPKDRERELGPRQRKSLDDLVFAGRFGEPADFASAPQANADDSKAGGSA
jgi:nitroreductase